MKVKILESCSGIDYSYRKAETVEVSAERGKDLVEAGFAEEVKTAAAKPKAGVKADADN